MRRSGLRIYREQMLKASVSAGAFVVSGRQYYFFIMIIIIFFIIIRILHSCFFPGFSCGADVKSEQALLAVETVYLYISKSKKY